MKHTILTEDCSFLKFQSGIVPITDLKNFQTKMNQWKLKYKRNSDSNDTINGNKVNQGDKSNILPLLEITKPQDRLPQVSISALLYPILNHP